MPKFLALVVLNLALCLPAMAQGQTTSAIIGSVVDPAGAAISGATVTIVERMACAAP
jgi:hypothetical protein